MELPCFPQFVPMTLALKPAMHPHLSLTPDGVSEYTFSSLYLFRRRYAYQISMVPGRTIVISGSRDGKRFFMTPCGLPDRSVLTELFQTHDYWKGIPDSIAQSNQETLRRWNVDIQEDRDNFDYLYLRTDLAELAGKKYHKKRNLIHAFVHAYQYRAVPLTAERIPGALEVLDRWKQDKGAEGDYIAAREALDLFGDLKIRGFLYYVDDTPAAWCLGEPLARGRMFTIHFEKAVDAYKGIYQYMNQAFAAALPRYYIHINREQDLGDEGLRQAKMTYRPIGFVRKYTGSLRSRARA